MWRGGGGGYFDKFHESISVQSITSLSWNWTLTAVNYCKHRSHTHDFRWSTLWTSARFIARICGGEGKIYWRWGKREWGWSFLKSYDEFGGEGLKIISAFSKWLAPPPHSKWTISPQTAKIDPQNPSSLKFVWRIVCEGARKDIHSGNWLYSLPDLQLVKSNVKSWKKRIGVRGAWRVGVLSTFFRAIDIEHYLTAPQRLDNSSLDLSIFHSCIFGGFGANYCMSCETILFHAALCVSSYLHFSLN